MEMICVCVCVCVCVCYVIITTDLAASLVLEQQSERIETQRPATWNGFVWITTGPQHELMNGRGLETAGSKGHS